jgi:hypothetical protein
MTNTDVAHLAIPHACPRRVGFAERSALVAKRASGCWALASSLCLE